MNPKFLSDNFFNEIIFIGEPYGKSLISRAAN